MSLIQLDTSCDLSTTERREALAKKLSELAAACIGKPEQYVMACVRDNVGTDADSFNAIAYGFDRFE